MARKLEVEIVGDTRQYERSLKRAARETTRFDQQIGKTFRGVAAGSGVFRTLGRSLAFASGGFIAAAGVTDLLRGSIEQASEAAATQKQLAAQFKASGQNLAQYKTRIDEATNAVSRLAGFEDDQLTRAFTTAFRGSENVSVALKIQAAAADVARARHIDLQTAALALTKAYAGQTTALKRLGVQIPANLHGMAALGFVQEKFAGQARAGTTAQDRFSAAFANFEEAVGKGVLPTFTKWVDSLSEWLSKSENQKKVQKDVGGTVKFLSGALEVGIHAVEGYTLAWDKFSKLMDKIAPGLDEAALRAQLLAKPGLAGPVGTPSRTEGLRGPVGTPGRVRPRQGASLAFQISLLNEQLAKAEITAGLKDDRALLVRLAALTREKIAKTNDLAKRTQLYQSLGSITEQIRAIDAKAAADRETDRQKELDAQKQAAAKAKEHAAKLKAALERQKQALKAAADSAIDQMGELFDVFVPDDPAKGIMGVLGGKITAKSLTARLKQQTDQAVKFNNDLARLAKRGAPPSLIASLRAQGLAGGMNVQALATASKADLNAFLRQYGRRQRVAQQIAHADIRAKTVTIVTTNVAQRATTPATQRRGRQAGVPLTIGY